MRAAGRATMLRDAVAGRDVAQPLADQPHPHQCRRLTNRADRVLLVDEDLPDLLRRLDAVLCLLPRGRREEVEYLEDVRILRLLALLAARVVPLRVFGPHAGLVWIDRYRMARGQ